MLKSKILGIAAAAMIASTLGLAPFTAAGASASTTATIGPAVATVPGAIAATTASNPHASQSLLGPVTLKNGTASDPVPVINDNSELCLGISGGKNDSPAVQWNCETVANQEWHTGHELGNTPYFQIVNNNNQCLGIAGSSTSAGARAYGWTCNGHLDQYWSADNSGVISNANSGMVLGVAGGSTAVGAAVVQWPFTGALNQFWHR